MKDYISVNKTYQPTNVTSDSEKDVLKAAREIVNAEKVDDILHQFKMHVSVAELEVDLSARQVTCPRKIGPCSVSLQSELPCRHLFFVRAHNLEPLLPCPHSRLSRLIWLYLWHEEWQSLHFTFARAHRYGLPSVKSSKGSRLTHQRNDFFWKLALWVSCAKWQMSFVGKASSLFPPLVLWLSWICNWEDAVKKLGLSHAPEWFYGHLHFCWWLPEQLW